MAKCKCDKIIGNTGLPKCGSIFKIPRAMWLMRKYKDDGTRNFIDLTALDDIAELFSSVTPADQRLYPLQGLEEVTSERAEAVFKEYASGTRFKIRDGIRSVNAIIPNVPVNYGKKVEAMNCDQWTVFLIDNAEQIAGGEWDQANDRLYGMEIDAASWNAVAGFATDSEIYQLTISFNFAQTQKDFDITIINKSELPNGFNPLDVQALLDVKLTVSGISTTGFTVLVQAENGSTTLEAITSLLLAAFTVKNKTTPATVVLTSVTESLVTPGSYVVVMPAQTALDSMSVQVANDFYESEETTFAIP